ncbi:MAG: radical SAM protein [Candidatus Aenigmarchaeota archaeon]|nr:radical SAM protein [Candidatus Aenigmarchaeota archaeon]
MDKPALRPAPTLPRVSRPEEIREVIERGQVATLSLRLPTPCNLDCVYCYGTPKSYKELRPDHLSYQEITGVIDQAAELGLRSVSFVGDGEPLLYRGSFQGRETTAEDLIRHVNKHGATVLAFTNALPIDPEMARRLYDMDMTIIAKQNSLDPQVQNALVRNPRADERLRRAISYLKDAGFNQTTPSRLAIHTVICKANYAELPDMWRQWREENIIPYVQVWVPPPRGSASYQEFRERFEVEPARVRELFHRLRELDEDEFGLTWDADRSYPIAALGCTVVLTGVGITPMGDVQTCAYTEQPIANVRQRTLREIMALPEIQAIRGHRYGDDPDGFHYGCRALTLNLTGDRLGRDPFYWEGGSV